MASNTPLTSKRGLNGATVDPVTAKDFVYPGGGRSIPRLPLNNGYLFSGIKNADAIQSNKKFAKHFRH